ncbi:MAG: DUF3368 domain-containing protein [Thermoplasmatota archaeon]
MIVVSDSGPLIHLSRINKIELLKNFFDKVYIPEAVYNEINSQNDLSGSKEVEKYEWIKKKIIDHKTAKELLMDRLDEGESEAIILAKKIDADLLLIDDLAGRNTARNQNIDVMGILGVLDRASEKNMIQDLEKVIRELRNKDFWMNDELFDKLIKD